ncbi:MAG TPA: hypothetical protein VGF94_09750 [Kofleriaceae bacterium]
MNRAGYIKRIVRALDRAEANLHPEGCGPDGRVNMTASFILTSTTPGYANGERFDGWNEHETRAVLLEYARRGPLDFVRRMAEVADREVEDWEQWDAVDFYEGRDWTPLFRSAAEARRWS